MNYITIADLKKQAKKERKNNNSIKNHAESLNVVAKQNNFDNWTSLIDNAVLLKKGNLIEDQQVSLLKEFVNESITFINGLQLIFKTDSHEMLAIFINKHFLPESEKKLDSESLWRERAKKWMECVCFIFLNSDFPRNIQGFRNSFMFQNMLETIENKNLYQNENVKYLFSMTGYDKQQKNLHEPDHDVLEQNGYCSMQYTACMGYIADSIPKYFNSNVAVTKNKIKDTLLQNDKLFTYDCFGLVPPILDQKRLLTQYKNSFKTDKDFKEALKIHLDLI